MIVTLGYKPNLRQREFFNSPAKHTAYGGARGGGKSWAMRTQFIRLAARYPHLRLLLLRRTLNELKENHVIPLQIVLAKVARYNSSDKVFVFPNGSRIKLGYCDAEADVYQYQGQEYDVIGLEEATHFTEAQMQFLTTCNRSTRADIKPRMYYTCNPGGVGHAWVKRLFIDRDYREKEKAEDYVFIPAKVYDNAVLMKNNPEYVQTLENLPEKKRRAHLDGDWDALEGQFFEEFRREKHVIASFKIPKHWKRFRSVDWGYNDPCAVLWHACDEDGHVYTYRELYVRQMYAADVAQKIVQMSTMRIGDEDLPEKIDYTVVSPDMWQKRGMKKDVEGENIADVFARNGVPVIAADNSRVVGWDRCRGYMQDAPDEKPWWQVTENCKNLIRTLPEMIYDATNAEDIEQKGMEDHAPESLRYALMSRPARTKVKEKQKPKPYDPFSLPKKQESGFFGL
ncbi:MAG TPA: phage terminase large subunit [Clostridia bacterium]|nr:phage terminase large subunit [Clostridia bacterium]